jgi:hypothetical protein
VYSALVPDDIPPSTMPGRKRKASATALETPTPRRQSGRVKKASLNYEESSVDDAPSDGEFKDGAIESDGAEDDDAEDAEKDESGDEYGPDEVALKKKGWKKQKGKGGRWEMVIELPGVKDPGNVEYRDESIHTNTLEFLRELKRNNRREWLKFHDAPYRLVLPISFSRSLDLV